ncbi:MAG TPA: polysaccharide deacetylase family protein [Pyrinomonadaceae bacterium]|nr:polysaccharide deacetylase family protein [Pyrinomonadaceae bacterium]
MKKLASLSLDLDNKWSYMKTHGDAGWESFPSYLDVVVPRALEFLKRLDLKITFFIVGQDAALEKNHEALHSIADAGHEIGNHSFNHEPWLHLYSKEELVDELSRAEEAIEAATGRHTVGFRGPGFSLTPTVLEVLAERGYEYDCSTLPTYIAPLARAYYFFKSPEMSEEEKAKRKKLFGKFSDGFATIKPHTVEAGGKTLVEIPVTTFPLVKTPIHVSYLTYLATFSKAVAMAYWRSAVSACRVTGSAPSLLLHPLDFMTGTDAEELKFFPGMSMPLEKKFEILNDVLGLYADSFDVVNVGAHAAAVRKTESVSTVASEVLS